MQHMFFMRKIDERKFFIHITQSYTPSPFLHSQSLRLNNYSNIKLFFCRKTLFLKVFSNAVNLPSKTPGILLKINCKFLKK
jgi:hypothetical protein